VYTIDANGTINAKPNIAVGVESNGAAQWPHWCVYVAWSLTWVAILVSGFFAILYRFVFFLLFYYSNNFSSTLEFFLDECEYVRVF